MQLALANHAASGRASYYYPPTPDHGPGHAVTAWRFLGLNQRDRMTDLVFDEVQRAERLGFQKLVLSSEEFSRALVAQGSFEAFEPVCKRVECEIVITLRPLIDRVYPEIQELIKNGQKLQLANLQDLIAVIMSRPGLRPDFLPAAIVGSGAASASVIFVNRDQPQKLFDGFSVVIGERIPAPRNAQLNASHSFIESAWLEVLNRYAGLKPIEARAVVEAGFSAASTELGRLSKVPYPALPEALEKYLEGTWHLQMEYMKALEQSSRIRCL